MPEGRRGAVRSWPTPCTIRSLSSLESLCSYTATTRSDVVPCGVLMSRLVDFLTRLEAFPCAELEKASGRSWSAKADPSFSAHGGRRQKLPVAFRSDRLTLVGHGDDGDRLSAEFEDTAAEESEFGSTTEDVLSLADAGCTALSSWKAMDHSLHCCQLKPGC